jgi:hypothetical protein
LPAKRTDTEKKLSWIIWELLAGGSAAAVLWTAALLLALTGFCQICFK